MKLFSRKKKENKKSAIEIKQPMVQDEIKEWRPNKKQRDYMIDLIADFVDVYRLNFGNAIVQETDDDSFFFLAEAPNHFTMFVDLEPINDMVTDEEKNQMCPITEAMILKCFVNAIDNLVITDAFVKAEYSRYLQDCKDEGVYPELTEDEMKRMMFEGRQYFLKASVRDNDVKLDSSLIESEQ